MTLNITLITPRIVIQASDRRMTTADGRLEDDDANKAVVLRCSDGVVAVTFTGVGKASKKRVDLWMAETVLDTGLPELSVTEVPAIIAQQATHWFSGFPVNWDTRHAFVVGGWALRRPGVSAPVLWRIDNCLAKDGSMVPQARTSFEVTEFRFTGRRAALIVSGLTAAVSRADRRRLVATVRRAKELDDMERTLVQCLRRASEKPESRGCVGPSCTVVCLAADLQGRSMSYPESPAGKARGPVFAWYEGGHNLTLGDVRVPPGIAVACTVGAMPFVIGMQETSGGERIAPAAESKIRIRGLFRSTKAKHHPHDKQGDVSLLGVRLPRPADPSDPVARRDG